MNTLGTYIVYKYIQNIYGNEYIQYRYGLIWDIFHIKCHPHPHLKITNGWESGGQGVQNNLIKIYFFDFTGG